MGGLDTTNRAIVQGSTKMVVLDRALADYGPETKTAREQLKRSIAAIWRFCTGSLS